MTDWSHSLILAEKHLRNASAAALFIGPSPLEAQKYRAIAIDELYNALAEVRLALTSIREGERG